MRKTICRMGELLCAFAVAFGLFLSLQDHLRIVSAEETDGSLSLWCVKDDDIVSGMHWQIYRVGHRVADDYVFEGAFEGYRLTLGDETKPMLEWDAETVADAGETLKIFTIVDNIPFINEGWTDENGSVTFEGLSKGLYLVWGDILQKGDTTYIPAAIFFEMREEYEAGLDAYPKIVYRTLSGSVVPYSVRKIWENSEDQAWDRNTSIIVERYCDNKLFDEIVLNEANNWNFEWTEKDGHEWFVHEKVIPEHYTVAYKTHLTEYYIVNTYQEDRSEVDVTTTSPVTTTATTAATGTVESRTTATTTETGTAESRTTATTAATGTIESRTTAKSTATTKTEEKVPQTGQLWWPVFLLGGSGLLLLGIGFWLKREGMPEHEKEE